MNSIDHYFKEGPKKHRFIFNIKWLIPCMYAAHSSTFRTRLFFEKNVFSTDKKNIIINYKYFIHIHVSHDQIKKVKSSTKCFYCAHSCFAITLKYNSISQKKKIYFPWAIIKSSKFFFCSFVIFRAHTFTLFYNHCKHNHKYHSNLK